MWFYWDSNDEICKITCLVFLYLKILRFQILGQQHENFESDNVFKNRISLKQFTYILNHKNIRNLVGVDSLRFGVT